MSQVDTYHPAPRHLYSRYNIKYRYDNPINGFTRAELHSLDALESPQARESNLQYIHPLYARNNWETSLPRHLTFYPLGGGREGYWKADNDVLWEILKPCIALASQFLQNIHCSHYCSALVNSDWEFHPASPEDLLLQRFRRRVGAQYFQGDREVLQDTLQQFEETLVFKISSAYCDPDDGMPTKGPQEAATILRDGTATICTPFERLAPLLENLSTSERIAEQFNVAIGLVHETAVSSWIVLLIHVYMLMIKACIVLAS